VANFQTQKRKVRRTGRQRSKTARGQGAPTGTKGKPGLLFHRARTGARQKKRGKATLKLAYRTKKTHDGQRGRSKRRVKILSSDFARKEEERAELCFGCKAGEGADRNGPAVGNISFLFCEKEIRGRRGAGPY